MDIALGAYHDMLALVGPLWPFAWIAAFVLMVLESSAPKHSAREIVGLEEPSLLRRLGGLASLVLPFVLFLHGFGAFILAHQDGPIENTEMLPVVALVAAIVVLVLVPSMIGAIFAKIAPGLGRALRAVTPYLAIGVCLFAFYVTLENVLLVLDLYVWRGAKPELPR